MYVGFGEDYVLCLVDNVVEFVVFGWGFSWKCFEGVLGIVEEVDDGDFLFCG